jgi:hypothetical protein
MSESPDAAVKLSGPIEVQYLHYTYSGFRYVSGDQNLFLKFLHGTSEDSYSSNIPAIIVSMMQIFNLKLCLLAHACDAAHQQTMCM